MNRRNPFGTAAASAAVTGASREHWVETHDGERLFIQDWGHGRPVVFVHGWTMNTEFWEYQTDVMAEHDLRCVAYDQRGCGRSSTAAFGYDLDSLADDLDAVMRTLDLHGAVIVAHSMGCAQVARYLSRYGASRVAKVALTCTTTPAILPDAAMAAPVMAELEAAIRADRPRYVREMAGPFFHPVEVSPDLVRWGTGLVLKASLRAAVAYTRTNLTSNLSGDLKAFTMPTLVIHGAGDQSSPLALTGAPTAAAIPDAKLMVYEDAPHGLPLTHADRLNRDLLAFVGV